MNNDNIKEYKFFEYYGRTCLQRDLLADENAELKKRITALAAEVESLKEQTTVRAGKQGDGKTDP